MRESDAMPGGTDVEQRFITTSAIARGAAAGLIAGLVASFVMDRFQAVVTAVSSSDSDAKPATDKTADRISKVLTGHELASSNKPLGGQLVHYALGAGLGALYGIAVEYRRAAAAGYGAAFGMTVVAVLDDAVVPALGLGKSPFKTGFGTHVYAITSHVIFGAATEFTRTRVRTALGTSDG